MNKEEFIRECENLGLEINEDILNKLNIYFNLLVQWNEKFNLTTIIQEKDVYLKHFYDSICIVKTNLIKNENIKLCDLGTGAGFPGIVIKIFFNEINVVLIESSTKKCEFLNTVIKTLNLKDIKIVNDRAEIYGKTNKEIFDIVTCRAVSDLRIILELSIPLLKVGGYFLPLKSNIEEELKKSESTLKLLDSTLERVVSYELPVENSKRNIPVIKKIRKTDRKYPREYKDIVKHLK